VAGGALAVTLDLDTEPEADESCSWDTVEPSALSSRFETSRLGLFLFSSVGADGFVAS
jgi:hypothetical protein